jgi:hypothetical protein
MLAVIRAIASGPPLATARQLASFGTAFVVANTLYKFGSFGVELIAFLITWLVLDAVFAWIHDRVP